MTARRAIAVALGLAVTVSACGSGEPTDTPEAGAASRATEELSVPAPESTAPSPADGRAPTAAAEAPMAPTTGSSTPSAPGSSAPAAAEEPSRYVPAPGDYVYDVTGYVETTGVGGGREPVPPVSVDTVTVRGPAERREMTIATRSGDDEASQELAVLVTSVEARLTRLTYRPGGAMAYDVHPQPPAMIARFPYVAGDAWEIAWRDPATGIAGTGGGTVAGPETVTTPLGVHETMVVTVRQRLRGTVNGTLSVTTWLDPRTGAAVKRHTVTDFDDATGASHAESTAVLRQAPR